jgi:prepilin-type N-terminal cleavage/methylation domain-containing protein
MKKRMHRRGFTLLEIMIVVSMIGILIAIGVPGFIRARHRSRGQVIQNDLTKIDDALQQYALDFDIDTTDAGTIPADASVLADEQYFSTAPEPPIEGQSYDMPASWSDYPTYSGIDSIPDKYKNYYRHPDEVADQAP